MRSLQVRNPSYYEKGDSMDTGVAATLIVLALFAACGLAVWIWRMIHPPASAPSAPPRWIVSDALYPSSCSQDCDGFCKDVLKGTCHPDPSGSKKDLLLRGQASRLRDGVPKLPDSAVSRHHHRVPGPVPRGGRCESQRNGPGAAVRGVRGDEELQLSQMHHHRGNWPRIGRPLPRMSRGTRWLASLGRRCEAGPAAADAVA